MGARLGINKMQVNTIKVKYTRMVSTWWQGQRRTRDETLL